MFIEFEECKNFNFYKPYNNFRSILVKFNIYLTKKQSKLKINKKSSLALGSNIY